MGVKIALRGAREGVDSFAFQHAFFFKLAICFYIQNIILHMFEK